MAVKVGDKVTTTAQKDWNGTQLCSFVRTNTYDVIQVGGGSLPAERVVIGKGRAVTAAVHVNTLSVVGAPTPAPATPAAPAAPTPSPIVVSTISGGSDILAKKLLSKVGAETMPSFATRTIEGSGVQNMGDMKAADASDDPKYNIGQENGSTKETNQLSQSQIAALDRRDPSLYVNSANFPRIKEFDRSAGYYRYDYYMDYDTDKLSNGTKVNADMDSLRKSLNTDILDRDSLYRKYVNYYNRFKVPNPNDRLAKTFSHVFFVRPDCNIFTGSGYNELLSNVKNLPEFYYAFKHCPDMLRQLTQANGGYSHQFMLYPSNKVRSFDVSDEYITEDTYGTALTGYKVAYGKHNVESRTAGKFSINYVDDRDLHIYQLHKAWTDYISYVYRGKLVPRDDYNLNKILDYATCLYYIVCAEDGETVLFWSKYWGVFPIEAPSNAFSYSAENGGGIKDPELKIEYRYSWKEDFNPLSLIEFNKHSTISDKTPYAETYHTQKIGTGYTWTGTPFIETWNKGIKFAGADIPYTFKLRFRPS